MNHSQKDVLGFNTSISPAAHAATATGSGVDLQAFEAATVVLNVGTITDGTHTPKLQESADNSTFTDVAAADQLGSLVALVSSTNQKVSYIGGQRYLRVVSTVSGATTGGVYSALVVTGKAELNPVA
jgi:hypothetical protein